MSRFLAAVFLAMAVAAGGAERAPPGAEAYARKVAALVAPTNLATLARERAANPRVQNYVALLAEVRAHALDATNVAAQAVALAGMKGPAAKLTVAAMVRNVTIAERLGCLDDEGLADMRKGQADMRKGQANLNDE